MAVSSNYRPYKTPRTAVHNVVIDSFHGVDLTSAPSQVDLRRSPNAPNMIPNKNGYPVTAPQYKILRNFGTSTNVHGVFNTVLDGAECTIIHVGTRLYKLVNDTITMLNITDDNGQVVLDDSDSSAVFMTFKGLPTLWILTGEDYWYLRNKVDGNGDIISGSYELAHVTAIATIPTISICKAPLKDGAAKSYEPINLMIDRQWEEFEFPQHVYLADGETLDPNYEWQNKQADAKDIYVSITPMIGIDDVVVKQLTAINTDGSEQWTTLTRVNSTPAAGQYSVSLATGLIHFGVSPGPSLITGQSNVRVYYRSERGPLSMKARKCRFCTLYGVGGQPDRIFMSGNPDEPNVDRWSEYGDPTYIGDTYYSVLGSDRSPIMGYSVLNKHLVTHKRDKENGRNAFVRYGQLDSNNKAVFPITNVVQGEGAASSKGYASVNSEPLFITDRGVYAITSSDLSSEKYNQLRSHYITGALIGNDMSKACGCIWGNFYVLASGRNLYFLNTDQKTYERNAGTSSYQYDCWYWTGIQAKNVWVHDGYLFVCLTGNTILKFTERWNEIGTIPYAEGLYGGGGWWKTPILTMGNISNKASVRDVTVMMPPIENMECNMSYSDGFSDWDDVMSYSTYNNDDHPRLMRCTRKMLDVTSFQVKLSSGSGRFGILGVELLYHNGIKIKAGG